LSTGKMHLVIHKDDLSRAITAAGRVVESRNTMPILGNLLLTATSGNLTVTATDLDIVATARTAADVTEPGAVCVDAKLIGDIAKKASGDITLQLADDKLIVKSGRSRFSLATLPAADFPTFGDGKYDATFDIDMAALFAPVSFAISTEETRYYLNGVFFRGAQHPDEHCVAVATDGHRLAKHLAGTLPAFEGVIVPRKVVGLLPRGVASVSVSPQKIRIAADDLVLVSKLIDGTFPDYERVIPKANDKIVTIDRDEFMRAADRVVTVSSEKGRSVKLSIAPGAVSLSARSEIGSAEDEVAADYSGEPIEIGFNSAYVRDMLAVLPSGPVQLALSDGGSPGLVTGGMDGLTLVIMPMRVN